jgi:hypothetical protein
MKTLNWTGFMGAPRGEPRNNHRLARVIRVLVRGAVPVDGYVVPSPQQMRAPRTEPLRWGKFR